MSYAPKKIEQDMIICRRRWLKQDLNGTGSHCALLALITCRLERGEMKKKALFGVAKEQGYTPSEVRNALSRLSEAKLIEHYHDDPSIFVRLNADGYQFLAEGF